VITDWCDDYFMCKVYDFALRLIHPTHRRSYGTRACAGFLVRAGYANTRVERYTITWAWGLMTATAQRPTSRGVIFPT
jgi:hypothetical protein